MIPTDPPPVGKWLALLSSTRVCEGLFLFPPTLSSRYWG
jgi:hypothetical protein